MSHNQLLTEEQINLLKELKLYQPQLQFRSLTQISLPQQNDNISNHKQQKGSKKYIKSIFSHLQTEDDLKYYQIKNRLLKYRQKSQQIYQVGEFIKQYEQGFNMLVKQKDQLVILLQDLKGETSDVVSRQKQLIDLSIGIKQCLDYYDFHNKFQFQWPCEITIRQMFQDRLQPILSSVMDGIQFFTENTNYASSKKYLNLFLSSRSKVISFIKSFYIKLFNKENVFVSKYYNSEALCANFDSLFTKSKLNFVTIYLICFPQFKRKLKHIISFAKDQNQKNIQQQKIRFLQTRQVQVEEFCLSQSNISLIRYMQKNNKQIYSQVILNLNSFNRLAIHQNLIAFSKRRWNAKQETQNFKNKYVFFISMVMSEYIYFMYYASPQTYETIQFIKAFVSKIALLYLQDLIKYLRQIKFKNPFALCQKVNIVHDQLPDNIKKLQSDSYELYIMGNLLGLVTQGESVQYLLQIFNSSYQKIITELEAASFNSLPKLSITKDMRKVQQNVCTLIQYIPKLKYCKSHQQNYMISSLDTIVKSIRQVNSTIPSRYECFAWNLIIFGSIKLAIKNLEFNVVRKELRLDVNESVNIIDKVRNVERTQNLLKYAQDILNVIVTGIPTVNQLTLDFVKYINQHCEQLQARFVKDNLFIYGKNMVQFLQQFNQIKQKKEREPEQWQKISKNEKLIEQQHDQTQTKQQNKRQNENQNLSQDQNKRQPISNKIIQGKNQSETDIELQNGNQSKQNMQSTLKNKVLSEKLKKLCNIKSVKSLYNGYTLSIQKFITESKDILMSINKIKVPYYQGNVILLKSLIKEVYEKLIDFLDTFYVEVSLAVDQSTTDFEQISKIKKRHILQWEKTISFE